MARRKLDATARRERGARVLTAVYALATVLALILTVLRSPAKRPTWLEMVFWIGNVPLSRSLVSAVVLLLTTRALMGRKRLGLSAVAAFQVLGIYVAIVDLINFDDGPNINTWTGHSVLGRGFDVASIVIGLGLLVWLRTVRPSFPGRLQPGSWIQALATLGVGFLLTVVVTWDLLALTEHVDRGTRWRHLIAAFARALGEASLWRREGAAIPAWVPQLTELMVGATIVAAVAVFLRSASMDTSWSVGREIAIRRLLAGWDADSLSYFATRRDKSSIFSPGGGAVVTYRVLSGVSLASGDPIGDPKEWAGAIRAWKDEARTYGWQPAALSASEAGARAYADAGLQVLVLGDEAILTPDRFSVETASMSDVRHAVRRAARAGLVVTVRRQDAIDDAELVQIVAAADRWRGDESDRGFSMALNRTGDAADGQVLFVTAHDASGGLMGVLSFVPWGRHGASLDLMRRNPDAPGGVTELMVCELMVAARDLGIHRVSLNFCMFRWVYADANRLGAGSLTRLNYSVLGTFDRFWQLERLYRANEKYEPQWSPRFLCYDDRVALPSVAVAAGIAEGFLPRWFSRSRTPHAQLTAEDVRQIAAIQAQPTVAVDELVKRADQTKQRIRRIDQLAEIGQDAYPVADEPPTVTLADVVAGQLRPADLGSTASGRVAPEGAALPAELRVVGRVRLLRDHGQVVFAVLTDDGASVQVIFDAATLGSAAVADVAKLLDIGDIVAVTARRGASRSGTSSLLAQDWQVMAKSLHPVPFRKFNDPERRLRQRSTDMIVHPEQVGLLRQRAAVLRSVRTTLTDEGFLEVETPILNTIHGGATARPFKTYINAYGMDLSLRIAPELYLKRLVVGGMGAVFEIGRNFRNEGADATHNPEFTSLEAYRPYSDYTSMRLLTERLVKAAATAIHGRPALPLPMVPGEPAQLVDVSARWPVVAVLDAVSAATGQPITLETDFDILLGLARSHDIHVRDEMGPGAIIEELYAELVEPTTVMPTFYVDFPKETSPLTRPHRTKPGLVERWDLVVNRMELGTAYTELTDPLDQRRRLTEQSLKAAAGDPEAMQVDEDFLFALETGMPPTGGLGMGVDRLVMLLVDKDIRSVISFPFVKPVREQ